LANVIIRPGGGSGAGLRGTQVANKISKMEWGGDGQQDDQEDYSDKMGVGNGEVKGWEMER